MKATMKAKIKPTMERMSNRTLKSTTKTGTIKLMENEFAELLSSVRLRRTKPRLAVLEHLAEHPHSTADQVRIGVTERLGSVSTQAVYDVLHAMTDKGLLRVVDPAGAIPMYEISQNDNHHHLICRRCRRICDVPCVVGEAPCLIPPEDHDFAIVEAEVTFWGICKDCQAENDNATVA